MEKKKTRSHLLHVAEQGDQAAVVNVELTAHWKVEFKTLI